MKQALKTLARNYARSHGWDFIKAPSLQHFLTSRNVDVVIDVGANDGGFGRHLRQWGYSGHILSFEPGQKAFDALSKASARDPLWNVGRYAAGAERGELTLNVSESSVFSSFKTANQAGRDFDPNIAVVATERVPVITLDSMNSVYERPFLKIDTQGYEEEVLKGATELLKRCVGVQLELPVDHLYDGVWKLEEAIATMRGYGFVLAQCTPTNPRHPDDASAAEFDGVFRRID